MSTPPRHPQLGGAVLAGGSSRRMGRDKAFITVDGSAMVERVARALSESGARPVVVVGGDPERVADLGLDHVADRHPGEGPLGGVITALGVVATDIVVVLACDLVEPSARAVTSVVGALGTSDVAVPVVDGREQWLHAAWRRAALPALEAAYEQGARAPRSALTDLSVTWLHDGDPCWYADADRPADLRRPRH